MAFLRFYDRSDVLPSVAGSYIVLASDEWWVFTGKKWRPMTVKEQIEASK